MANVNVSGILQCSDGTIIPLDATLAEGTESNLTTNTDYTVSASNVGDYAPGKVITHGFIQADHDISYAFILRQGLIATILPVGVKGLAGSAPSPCVPLSNFNPVILSVCWLLQRPHVLPPHVFTRTEASIASSTLHQQAATFNQSICKPTIRLATPFKVK